LRQGEHLLHGPGAAVAMPGTIRGMKEQTSSRVLDGFWRTRIPGQIPENVVNADELEGGVIELEGHELTGVTLGHTDTHDTTCLHVPSIGLAVAGDAVYHGVHQLMAESDAEKRREWIAAVDRISALNPRVVIAGHKRPGNSDGPHVLKETRQYIRDFDRAVGTAKTARELFDRMLELHPQRMNVTTLWAPARAAKGAD